MAKNFKEINAGSRTALVKSSNIYGGQILTAIATAPDAAPTPIGNELFRRAGSNEGNEVLFEETAVGFRTITKPSSSNSTESPVCSFRVASLRRVVEIVRKREFEASNDFDLLFLFETS